MRPAAAPTRRALLRAGAAALALTAVPGALGLPAAAAARLPEKIVIGTLPFNTAVAAFIGDTDFFRDEGLAVEFSRAASGAAALQALVAGSIPLADIGLAPAILATARGLALVHLALGAVGTPRRPLSRIMVRGDSPIQEVAALKGRKLALHGRGALEDLSLAALKKTHGIGHEELELVMVPAPSQPQALAQGAVDAIYALPPADTVAEQRFHARTLIGTADFIPYLGYGTLAMRRDFVEAYPDAAKRVMKAWCRFCRWIGDNAAAARKVVDANLNIDDARAKLRLPYFARNGLPVMPNLWHVYELLVAGKAMEAVGDPAKLFEETVAEPTRRITLMALDELGWDKDAAANHMLRAKYPLLRKPPEAYYTAWERKLLTL